MKQTIETVIFWAGTLVMSQMAAAQQMHWPASQAVENHTFGRWSEGTSDVAQAQSVQGSTIPMSTFTHVASKDGKTYTSTIVGTNPFNPASWLGGAPINAVVVPLIFGTGSLTFDPTVGDLCDANVPALTRFKNSPLVNKVPLIVFNQDLGNTQFINGFRRAEFWKTTNGNPAYQNPINFSYLGPVGITGAPLTTLTGATSSGCPTTLGVLSGDLKSFLESIVIPGLQSGGLISPNQFVFFLMHNVVQQAAGGYILGFHGAIGSPVQTYAVADWDTTSIFGSAAADASVSSHEIAEWMDDPLGTNLTPSWGKVGQVSGCTTAWESGDPLTGTVLAPIVVASDPDKYKFHMQDLAFYSFFFNSATDPSVGASYYAYNQGTFSIKGTYLSAANACPPGGLAPFGGKYGQAAPNPTPPSQL